MSEQLGSCWPFVGRGGQLARVREALRARAGVMIVGEAGVGKSRLAAQALSGLGGYGVVRALGTATAATIPFGAFAHALTGPPGAGENLLRWAARHLRAGAGGGRLLVSVDDAHRLDPASAALVHHLASSGTAAVLVTVRSGARPPAPITALWKDEVLDRIELPPLDRDGIEAVLAEALGGEVARPTVRRLAEVSGGNLLYLRELVHAGRASGRLAVRDGTWGWRGELSLTARLRELVEARIGRLEPDERETLELVAFGEPLGAGLVAGLTSAEVVERLEDRGLVATETDGRREHLRLGHPLYGEVIRDGCGTLRSRRRLRTLAEALEAGAPRRREDVLRAAVWRLDSGSPVEPATLLDAAGVALARQDPRLAARLARAAHEAGAGVSAVALLGQALVVLGESETAVAALRRAASGAVTEGERARHAASLGINLAWAGADAEACAVLDAAGESVTDPALRREVRLYRGMADFLAGRLSEAARSLGRSRASSGAREASGAESSLAGWEAQAAGLEAWIGAYAGRTEQSLAVVQRVLTERDDRWPVGAPHALPALLDAACAARVFSGRLEEAARTAERGMALGEGEPPVTGFGAHRAVVARLRGDVAGAARWAGEDAARLPAGTPYQGRCLAELAHASALLGQTVRAGQALAEAERLAARWAFTRQPALQAAVWVAAADGDLDGALSACRSAAEHAEEREQSGYLMFALHDLVRLGRPEEAAGRLAGLAGRVDGPLVRLLARHARAAGDPGELRAVAVEFERLGMVLYAAEAAAHEAAAYLGMGRGTQARGARTRAWALARRCPGVTTPALVELATPELTPRQREIVRLAAAGLTNRQIAARLAVSTRTAANHLQAVYDKLGVNDRMEVGRLLGAP
ncbi:LuxR C-terminal-related transcriptional regulator [Nonomuraea sp. NPDC050691]|uniref:LuxR C-terminal-related transcriptional regulator n=1 Tax=Nonomuraea sp. NPDC050691 TaxID=3155661 RepID=UPI003404DC85